ncbi:hypothetical protein N8J89_14485 [Crossiella sp. CA-258035]|uniref:hypothetical protein n=1 Tax=Crossiella sp. CA-258035 TaxID=2981138 RepID=UPI0024BC1786|nr:hypothetical protein [Crossiella sp. CA-258035]WHT22224.1 hypothetical protein N8J89_14485 [Crossiella sp. CA-258035]
MLVEVTDEVREAFDRLLPQLSTSATPLDHAALVRPACERASRTSWSTRPRAVSGSARR